jgi:RNA-directed DNA polymerase
MGIKRQKIRFRQLELVFPGPERDEVPKTVQGRAEVPMAKPKSEGPAPDERLMEEVCERENLKRALSRVKANHGSPGVDGMPVGQLPEFLKEHWTAIRDQLLSGTYQPQPVRRKEIPKAGGGRRKLGIPTVLDRFIQQAVMQVLQRRWDRTFSECSFGFRPNRSAHQAVAQAQRIMTNGYRVVVDIDIEKFFDRVHHDLLMGRVAKRVSDKRMLKLIRAYLRSGILEAGLVRPTEEGTPQGGPLSPLLSNLLLDDLDRELERRGLCFVRYADDCNIYVRSERTGHRVMKSVQRFLMTKLKLKVNGAKSAVARPEERKFLGFSFTGGPTPKRRIAPQAQGQFCGRVRRLTRRTRGVSVKQMITELSRYLIGWRGYFGYCETPSVFNKLDAWVRRRLRCVVWKQWKRGRKRFAELRARGVGTALAAQTAGSAHGPWRISHSPALTLALPNAYFASLGLPSLAPVR